MRSFPHHNGVSGSKKCATTLPVMAVEPFNTQHPRTLEYHPQYTQQQYSDVTTGGGGGGELSDNDTSTHRPYPDGERSSSGSESKLLLRV